MDYGYPEKRKNKGDWKAKRRFNKYKKGGAMRSANSSFCKKANDN
jgi:hypothetical protein